MGYNFQWDNAVIGLEFNYTHAVLNADVSGTTLTLSQNVGGLIDDVAVNASGLLHISDFATTRARFGWAIDNFMPYATIGLAFGRADMAVSTTVHVTQTDPNTLVPNPNSPPIPPFIPKVTKFSLTQSNSKDGAYLYGFSAGVGTEVALTDSIFARGEYEFIDFQRLWQIATIMHNFRLGLGVKF
jgi:opacity protein-like surface antigen